MKNLICSLFSILILGSSSFSLLAQGNFPENGPVFRDDMVPRVDIIIPPDTLDWIYENVDDYTEFRATFIFTSDTLIDTIPEIGFRLRGNTSRQAQKKSFKVSFNTYRSGRQFYGLEKMNLNGEHNDPSVIRAKIAWDLYRNFGIPTPRANHVEVYINGNYYGLYINAEHIDEEFVNSRFENKDGNLYKCLWPADLDYRGSDPENYKHMQGDRRVYDLKTNVLGDNYTDIAQFIGLLNQLPNAVFACEIEDKFNVLDYLRVVALDVFISNWDGPIYNKNNFYLYHNTNSNRMEYIPYDLDNTFGIDWFDRDWQTRNIYDWRKHGEPRPIYSKMMDNEELRMIYTQYMAELLSDEYTGAAFLAEITRIKNMITPYIGNDPYYPLDYGYTVEDFHNSYQTGLGAHVPVGIFPYLETRKSSALQQLEDYSQQPIINHIRYKVKNEGRDIRVRAYVREDISSVVLSFTLNDGPELELEMFDDGMHNDVDANDGIYANTFENLALNEELKYQIIATQNASQNIKPCEPIIYKYQASLMPPLFINEFMASNDTTIADEYGDYGDWIEIYNAGTVAVFLGDKYLSDNLGDRNKWSLPNTYLSAKDFILIWADGNTGKGDLHTNFKLSASGEEIGLFDSEFTGYHPLDTLIFGAQQTDISQGRYADGESEWRFYSIATPGFSNLFDDITELQVKNEFSIYPNPTRNGKVYFNEVSDIKVYHLNGKLLLQAKEVWEIDLSGLSSGIYLIQNKEGNMRKLVLQ